MRTIKYVEATSLEHAQREAERGRFKDSPKAFAGSKLHVYQVSVEITCDDVKSVRPEQRS